MAVIKPHCEIPVPSVSSWSDAGSRCIARRESGQHHGCVDGVGSAWKAIDRKFVDFLSQAGCWWYDKRVAVRVFLASRVSVSVAGRPRLFGRAHERVLLAQPGKWPLPRSTDHHQPNFLQLPLNQLRSIFHHRTQTTRP
ncbi:hypothetical protein BC567DRAFT_50468 [Phyllosticta citribraziliensis]